MGQYDWKVEHTASVDNNYSNTQAKVTVNCYWRNVGWNYNIAIEAWNKCENSGWSKLSATSVNTTSDTDGRHLVGSSTFYVNKGTSGRNVSCQAAIKDASGNSYAGGSTKYSTATNVWISAKPSYTVAFNANGGSGAPAAQTKWYGTDLTLSATKPTRTGYEFRGWATSQNGSVVYAAGGKYTANSSATLYAVWKPLSSVLNAISSTELGHSPVVSWTPYVSDAVFALTFSLGNWTETIRDIAPGSTNVYTLQDYVLPLEACRQLPNVTSGTMKATLTTYIGGVAVGTSELNFYVFVPASIVPDVTYSVKDIGQNVFAGYVQDKTVLEVEISTAGAYGSTVNSAVFSIDDQKIAVPVVNDTAKLTSTVLTVSGIRTIELTVTDSRDRTTSRTETIEVYPYHAPTVSDVVLNVDVPNVIASFRYDVSEVDETNIRYIQIDRIRAYDQARTTVVEREALPAYIGTYDVTDSVSDIDTRNYTYQFLIEDSYGIVTFSKQIRPGAGDRFGELHSDEYFIGVDKEGFKLAAGGITGNIENGVITFNRESGDEPAGVGIPVELEPNTTYELVYTTNVVSDETVVCVSFFDSEFNYIATYDTDYLIEPGEKFTAPEGTAWGLFVFGSAPTDYSIAGAGYRIFSGIAVRKVNEPEQEEIEWMVETGNLGLDTPSQKYISRIQMRIEYTGTLRVGISYDNDKPFELVHSSVSDHMRSITVPINVKRCDHFRLRLRGIGQAKLYSMGYYTEDGSARCLI